MANTRHAYYPGLDLLRVAAALAVALYHLAYWSWAVPQSTSGLGARGLVQFPDLTAVSWWGFIGVQVFFVISGVVITASAEGNTPSRFARSRLLRLWPAIAICAAIDTGVALATGTSPVEALRRYGGALWVFGQTFDSAYWTLQVELLFYGIVGALLFFKRERWLPALALLLALTSCAWMVIYLLAQDWPAFGVWGYRLHTVDDWWSPLPNFLRAGGEFATGMMLYHGVRQGWTINRGAMLAVALLAGSLQILYPVEVVWRKTLMIWHPASALLPILLWLAGALLVWLSLRAPATGHPRLWRAVRLAGLATYSFYLLQNYVGSNILGLLRLAAVEQHVALVAAIVVCAGASLLVARWGEPALRSLITRALPLVGRHQRQG